MLSVGDKAPGFVLPNQSGRAMNLSELLGSFVLIYFYPKDDTPGCTIEACGLRDSFEELNKELIVLGVSADSPKSHQKFIDKFKLPYDLLSDEKKDVIKAYGALKEKKMFGKSYMGINRISYLIGPDGKVVKVYPKVKPEDHAGEVLVDVKKLRS